MTRLFSGVWFISLDRWGSGFSQCSYTNNDALLCWLGALEEQEREREAQDDEHELQTKERYAKIQRWMEAVCRSDVRGYDEQFQSHNSRVDPAS